MSTANRQDDRDPNECLPPNGAMDASAWQGGFHGMPAQDPDAGSARARVRPASHPG